MPRFSQTSRCATCGKEVSQSGHARQWVHENEFYAKADHPAEPIGNTHIMPKKPAAPVAPARREAPTQQPKPKADGNRPRSIAELRMRLQQGTAQIAPEDTASRRRRIAAIDAAEADTGPSETDLAARRLRMLRNQGSQDDQR